MTDNTNNNTAKWDRYSGGTWSKQQQETLAIREEYARGGHSQADKHRFADRLRELFGGVQTAQTLIPMIVNEHRRSVEWALERVLVASAALETAPYVEAADRAAVSQRVKAVLQKIDAGDFDEAEREIRELERRVAEVQMQGLDLEVETLLSGIGAAYAPVQ
jgi:predicted outer membrane protein